MRGGEEGCEFALGSRRVLVAPLASGARCACGSTRSLPLGDYRL
jgi:hypothetical protein